MTIIVELLHCFEEQKHLKGVSHISYFCGKILGKSNLRKAGFNLAHGLGCHTIIPAEAEAAGHVPLQPEKGERRELGLSLSSLFLALARGMGQPVLRVGLPRKRAARRGVSQAVHTASIDLSYEPSCCVRIAFISRGLS